MTVVVDGALSGLSNTVKMTCEGYPGGCSMIQVIESIVNPHVVKAIQAFLPWVSCG